MALGPIKDSSWRIRLDEAYYKFKEYKKSGKNVTYTDSPATLKKVVARSRHKLPEHLLKTFDIIRYREFGKIVDLKSRDTSKCFVACLAHGNVIDEGAEYAGICSCFTSLLKPQFQKAFSEYKYYANKYTGEYFKMVAGVVGGGGGGYVVRESGASLTATQLQMTSSYLNLYKEKK